MTGKKKKLEDILKGDKTFQYATVQPALGDLAYMLVDLAIQNRGFLEFSGKELRRLQSQRLVPRLYLAVAKDANGNVKFDINGNMDKLQDRDLILTIEKIPEENSLIDPKSGELIQ